jgi:predicted metal-dependent enzyme (double-stranded beta helix superfamily)
MGNMEHVGHTLETFAAQCHDFIKAEPGPAGRKKVCGLLSQVLADEKFVAKYVDPNTKERNILYQDPDFGFCIIAHNYEGPKTSDPHDHGPSWAIYGQARGETAMNDWSLLEAASEQKPGKVKHVRTYKLTPGVAHLYNEGDLHSPTRDASTKLIRIEGMDMTTVKRFKYVAV